LIAHLAQESRGVHLSTLHIVYITCIALCTIGIFALILCQKTPKEKEVVEEAVPIERLERKHNNGTEFYSTMMTLDEQSSGNVMYAVNIDQSSPNAWNVHLTVERGSSFVTYAYEGAVYTATDSMRQIPLLEEKPQVLLAHEQIIEEEMSSFTSPSPPTSDAVLSEHHAQVRHTKSKNIFAQYMQSKLEFEEITCRASSRVVENSMGFSNKISEDFTLSNYSDLNSVNEELMLSNYSDLSNINEELLLSNYSDLSSMSLASASTTMSDISDNASRGVFQQRYRLI